MSHVYLGDGVYAEAIDDRINLRLGDHRSDVVVVLEAEVLHQLILFADEHKLLPNTFTYIPL